nr:hypothetical protein [Streptomyces alboflavus]
MHPDVHLMLHHARAAELRLSDAAPDVADEAPHAPWLRAQLGWTLVELGLRLVSSSGPSRPSPGLAASRPYSPA